MSKKKNGFREWLSDNLRYVILGFAMLVILALLYIGYYLSVSLVAGTQLKGTQSVPKEQESELLGDDIEESDSEEDSVGASDEHETVEDNSTDGNTSEENISGEMESDSNAEVEDASENGTQEE